MKKRLAFCLKFLGIFFIITFLVSWISIGPRFNKICLNLKDTASREVLVLIDSNSFTDYHLFENYGNYFYPWGSDHNGSARMVASSSKHLNLFLEHEKTLHRKAVNSAIDLGISGSYPHLTIKYISGAIHAKHQVLVNDAYPVYSISGSFKAPTVKGSWHAFWLTSVNIWPPESDILEFKDDSLNCQNTFIIANQASSIKTKLENPATDWHEYVAVLKKVTTEDIDIYYYINKKLTGIHCCNFMNKPMWIIINLQMEGSSGHPGPIEATDYYIKDNTVKSRHYV